MEPEPGYGPIPKLVAMLLCEMAIAEQGTNRKTLVGIFYRLIAHRFPARQKMAVYVRLTDAQGAYKFKLELVDVDRDRSIAAGETDAIQVPDRLEPFDFAMPFEMTVAEAGLYEFRLYVNDAYLDSLSFDVVDASPKGG